MMVLVVLTLSLLLVCMVFVLVCRIRGDVGGVDVVRVAVDSSSVVAMVGVCVFFVFMVLVLVVMQLWLQVVLLVCLSV